MTLKITCCTGGEERGSEVRVGFVLGARVSSNSGVAARSSAQLAADRRRLCTASHSSQAALLPAQFLPNAATGGADVKISQCVGRGAVIN